MPIIAQEKKSPWWETLKMIQIICVREKSQQKCSESTNVSSFSLSEGLLLELFYSSIVTEKVFNELQVFKGLQNVFEI